MRWLAKATFKRITGLYYRDQMNVLSGMRDRVHVVQEGVSAIQAAVQTQDELMSLAVGRLRAIDGRIDALEELARSAGEQQSTFRKDAAAREVELIRLVRSFAPQAATTNLFWSPPSEQTGDEELVMSKALSNFYLQFQDRHRGTEELIRERQKGRVPLFASCKRVLDIGCGRGEFLELLQEDGIEAEGIDLSVSSVERCKEKGLSVTRAEAKEFLATRPRGTFDGVHMSHVLEHMPFGSAVQLLETCAAHLQPGGVLVAETPNPHSPEALQAFFLDPTHVRPLFPEALVILLESVGFGEAEARFLNPVRQQANGSGALPHDFADYLMVGVKAADDGEASTKQSEPEQPGTERPAAST